MIKFILLFLLISVTQAISYENELDLYLSQFYKPHVATVTRVVDGDTIKLKVNGSIITGRLGFIDTPESYHNTKFKRNVKECKVKPEYMLHLGLKAKEYVKYKYPKGTRLIYFAIGTGRYKRKIIWIKDLNYDLLHLGYADLYSKSHVDKHFKLLLQKVRDEAKATGHNIWDYYKKSCM